MNDVALALRRYRFHDYAMRSHLSLFRPPTSFDQLYNSQVVIKNDMHSNVEIITHNRVLVTATHSQ